jgi:hypothetical protein
MQNDREVQPAADRPLMGPNGSGRISKGFRTLGTSWDLLKRRPVLLVLPAISAAAVTIAAYAIFVPVLYLDHDLLPGKLAVVAAGAAVALPFTLITTFCNVGFVTMVQAHFAGEEPSVRDGLLEARRRLRTIVLWSLLATLVGGVLRSVEEIPGVGALAGKIVALVGGVAWSLATYFIVPVIVVEETGVRQGIRRSATVFRKRWGETLTGGITLGAAFGILMIPGCFLLGGGLIALETGGSAVTGMILIAIAVLWVAPMLAVSSALTEMFQLVLYREATGGALPAGFNRADVNDAFHRRRRWFSRNSDDYL